MTGPIDGSYEFVENDGRTAGQGSPRHSGDETASFLRRSGADQSLDPELGGRSGAHPYTGMPRVPVPPTASQSSSGSSSTNHSGYGVLIERPTLNLLPSTTEELARERRGQILTPDELRQMNEESVLPQASDYSPLTPPPRLVDPESVWVPTLDREPFKRHSSQLSLSAYPDADEPATLLTARRVRVEDITRSPPRLPLQDVGSSSNGGGFLSSFGFGRLSWLKNFDSSSRRNSRTHSFLATPLTDEDIEASKSLLARPEMSESQSSRRLGFGLGLGFDGERPVSSVSARSAGTVYHDAYSSLPGTPISTGTPLAPLPRALTPSGHVGSPTGWTSTSTVALPGPPPYHLQDPAGSQSPSIPNVNHGLPTGYDILDTPAPLAVSPFTSIPSIPSLHETATGTTGSSSGIMSYPLPPGLEVTPKMWTDASSSATDSPFTVVPNHATNAGISIDVLEEEPPRAGNGWRSMAAEQAAPGGRRSVFGPVRAFHYHS